MFGRDATVTCPVCGTDALYTARGVDAREYHRVDWCLGEDGMVLASWRTGDGVQHAVVLRPQDVYCSGCNTRVGAGRPWREAGGVAPWPPVFFAGV